MTDDRSTSRAARVGFWAGLGGFLLVLLLPPEWTGLPVPAQRLLAVVVLMGAWWFTQALPLAATSLVPVVLFPLLGVQQAKVVSKAYMDHNIMLFLGGFIIALGIEKCGLHRRMALSIVSRVGTSPRRIVLGFMLATAFLSMWISNTATTLLMLPIALALLGTLEEDDTANRRSLSIVLLLGIAYSASLGGLSTLVGTPPNVFFAGFFSKTYPNAAEISMADWMLAAVPLSIVFLVLAWLMLTWGFRNAKPSPQGREFFRNKLRELGRMSVAERRMLILFSITAVLWITGKLWRPLVYDLLIESGIDESFTKKAIHDSTVAMLMALLLFVIPAKKERGSEPLMDWKTAERLPWGILLLFGGGLALAGAFQSTGLSKILGSALANNVEGWPVWLIVATVCFLMTFLTEFTSNLATVTTLLPVLADAALALEMDPKLMLVPATISASLAFMLPIATPPNAIVFGSERLKISDMALAGIKLNLLGVVLVTLATFVLFVPALGIAL